MLRRIQQLSAICLLLCTVGLVITTPVHAQESVGVNVGDTILQLNGQTSPHAYVTLRSNTAVIATFNAAADGTFSQTLPAQTPGITQLSLSAIDTAGNTTDSISMQVNLQPFLPTDVEAFLPTSLQVNPQIVTSGQTITANGQTMPNGTIVIRVDNQTIGRATAAHDGTWQYSLASASLPTGNHQLFATVIDAIGNQSYPTNPYQFVILPQQPASVPGKSATTLPVVLALNTPIIEKPTDGATVRQSPVTVSGKGPSKTQIEIWDSSRAISSVLTDSLGNWSSSLDLTNGKYTIRARACEDTLCSKFSKNVTFSVSLPGLAQQKLQATLNSYAVTTYNNSVNIPLHIQYGITPYTVVADWGDNHIDTTTVNGSQTILRHSYANGGKYTCHVTVSDSSNTRILNYTVDVAFSSKPYVTINLLMLYIKIGLFVLALLALYYLPLFRAYRHSIIQILKRRKI